VAEKNPRDYRVFVQLAGIMLQGQKPGEALQHLKKAVATGKDTARQMIAKDPRFAGIRNTKDYVRLMYPGQVPGAQPGLPQSPTQTTPVIPRSVLPPGQK
jgi:hypothetical protein